MSAEQVVRSYFDALEAKDLVRIDAVISPDLVFVTPLKPLGKQDLLNLFTAMFDAFPTVSREQAVAALEAAHEAVPARARSAR